MKIILVLLVLSTSTITSAGICNVDIVAQQECSNKITCIKIEIAQIQSPPMDINQINRTANIEKGKQIVETIISTSNTQQKESDKNITLDTLLVSETQEFFSF